MTWSKSLSKWKNQNLSDKEVSLKSKEAKNSAQEGIL